MRKNFKITPTKPMPLAMASNIILRKIYADAL